MNDRSLSFTDLCDVQCGRLGTLSAFFHNIVSAKYEYCVGRELAVNRDKRRISTQPITHTIIPVREVVCKSHVETNEYGTPPPENGSTIDRKSIGGPVLPGNHKSQVSPVSSQHSMDGLMLRGDRLPDWLAYSVTEG
jgi:hypothetical protein